MKSINGFFLGVVLLVSASIMGISSQSEAVDYTAYGANFNKSPEDIKKTLFVRPELEEREVQWVRASVNMLELLRDHIDGPVENKPIYKDRPLGKGKFKDHELEDIPWNEKWRETFEQFKSLKQGSHQYKVILTFRYKFFGVIKRKEFNHGRLPLRDDGRPDSEWLLRNYAKVAKLIIDELGSSVDVVVVGNEPVLETRDEDQILEEFTQSSGRVLTYTRMDYFYRLTSERVHQYLTKLGLRESVRVFIGAFNKLHLESWHQDATTLGWSGTCDRPLPNEADYLGDSYSSISQECDFQDKIANPGIHRMLRFAHRNSFINGIDLHLHVHSIDQAREQLVTARSYVPDKHILASEFSLIYLFRKHLKDSMCRAKAANEHSSLSERDFCNKHQNYLCRLLFDRSSCGLTEIRKNVSTSDFLNSVYNVSPELKMSSEMTEDFYRSREYLPENFFLRWRDIFNEHRVSIATYGYVGGNPNDSSDFYEEGCDLSGSGPSGQCEERFVDGDQPWNLNTIFNARLINSVRDQVNPSSGTYIRANPYFWEDFKKLNKVEPADF